MQESFSFFLLLCLAHSLISNPTKNKDICFLEKKKKKSLAVPSDSESEVEPFITQTKAASVAVL